MDGHVVVASGFGIMMYVYNQGHGRDKDMG